MDLTDEDLELMASAMWKELSPPALPSSADERGALKEKEKSDASVYLSPGPIAKTAQTDQKKRPAKKVTGGSKNTNNSKTKTRKRVSKKRESLFAELEVSSPDVSVRPKDHKLSKSMKGASQNESQMAKKAKQAEASETRSEIEPLSALGKDADLYSFPISPTSSSRVKKAMVLETNKSPRGIGSTKMSSPLAPGIQTHLNNLHEKFSKPQKRVAKRSFLDPPETPQPEPKVKLQLKSEKLLSLQKPTAAASTKRQTKKASPAQKALTFIQPSRERPAPDVHVKSKLRPRRERAPIVISSDPESGGEETGDTDFLETGYMSDADCSSRHSSGGRPQLSGTQRAYPPENEMELDGTEVHRTSVATTATAKTLEATGHESGKAEKSPSIRAAAAHTTDSTSKRRAAQRDISKTDRREKKTRLSSDHDNIKEDRAQPQNKTRSGTNSREKTSVPIPPLATGDPFTADSRDTNLAQTKFTEKLLQSAGMGSQSTYAVPEAPHMQHVPPQVCAHEGLTSKSIGQQAQQALQAQQAEQVQQVQQVQREKSDGIARQMMRLFADIDAVAAGDNGQQQHAERALWLDETETYGETGQIMGYVCKTILRFLKSKEAAIEDVANEYHQRGAIVLARVESLHKSERHKLVQQFEQARLESLGVFGAACNDIRILIEKLQQVRLAPVVNSVFADNAVSRLRALQTEVA